MSQPIISAGPPPDPRLQGAPRVLRFLHARGVARTLVEFSLLAGHGDLPHSEKTRSMGWARIQDAMRWNRGSDRSGARFGS